MSEEDIAARHFVTPAIVKQRLRLGVGVGLDLLSSRTGSQIPMGMLLDRFGPRRFQSALLLLAAALPNAIITRPSRSDRNPLDNPKSATPATFPHVWP
ncbi:hypothetical protein ACVWXN_007040 [Bradyrhizobium sp. i1.4.4]